ncbi:MAG: ribosomal subunit interface protein [Chloroflexi bacterium RBG_13_56_8]|nr:MAG: ribosomal subunit interface protein [Chloroflexi bacterium RBG_13_56_8]
MQILIKGKNLEVTDRLRSYIEKKVNRLDRFLPNIDEAEVDLSVQSTKSAQDRQAVQLTLRANGAILRAEDHSSDMQGSIDAVLDKISRQIERYKGKHWRSQNRAPATEEVLSEEAAPESQIVRTKRFQTRAMNVEEAIEQMELLGHDFFVFFNADTDSLSVVYRRRDGGYGLLLPEVA